MFLHHGKIDSWLLMMSYFRTTNVFFPPGPILIENHVHVSVRKPAEFFLLKCLRYTYDFYFTVISYSHEKDMYVVSFNLSCPT